MSEYLLSGDQQRMSEQRIIHDAELLNEGATINNLGVLVITEAQHWGFSDKDIAPDSQTWLLSDITTLYESSGVGELMGNRPLKTLLRSGISRVQQVLALGRHGMPSGIGSKSLHAIDFMLSNDFGFEWKDFPTYEDIAHYCSGLEEVPGQLIHRRIKSHFSVADVLILAETDVDLSPVLFFDIDGIRELDEDSKRSVIETVRGRTISFSREFARARAEIKV